ncbi:MAG: site-specific DNA-methyltransferase, partial [bacterium]|nr:site-specific DNA-methyltransferase [bacterium]
IKGDLTTEAYSVPLTLEFLEQNPFLVLDTAFFSKQFKHKLVAHLGDKGIDKQCNGLLIHSENFQALELLQEKYANSVKCVFIDPPYNTAGDDFIYKDNFKESSWMSLMADRLLSAKNELSSNGVLFITIDDNEVEALSILAKQIFGKENHLATIIWQHSIQPKGYLDTFSVHHNYILMFKKTDDYEINPLERNDEDNKAYSNPDNDPKGPWRSGDVRNALYRPNLIYDIVSPSGNVIKPCDNGWRWSKETVDEKIKAGEIVFSKDETRIIRKIYLSNVEGRAPETLWFAKDVGSTRDAMSELKSLFEQSPFGTPKPSKLVIRAISLHKSDDCLVFDFFAGSGTTGEAVINQNRSNGNRKFILCEMAEYFKKVTKPRIEKVI